MSGLGNLLTRSSKYLRENKERFTEEEKTNFNIALKDFLCGNYVLADEVYDFLISEGFIKSNSRATNFANYIKAKYPLGTYKKVLDVGAGRMCHLSRQLADVGYQVYAMDPNIRLTEEEADLMKIKKITKLMFECDKFAVEGKGTPVDEYDFLIGLEPCEATEHIIRQGLKHDKPFEVSLCLAAHDALNGRKFKTVGQWYDYLKSLSREIELVQFNNCYILTNNKVKREISTSGTDSGEEEKSGVNV